MIKISFRLLGLHGPYGHIVYGLVLCFLVLFPCLIESFEIGGRHERLKEDFGFFVSDKGITIDDVIRHVLSRVYVFSKEKYLHYEGFSENSGGLVEFGDSNVFPDSVNGKTMLNEQADKIAQEATENSAGNAYNYFCQFIQHKDFPFIAFIWGNITGVLLLGLIFIFITQRIG